MSKTLKQELIEFMNVDLDVHNQEEEKWQKLYDILDKYNVTLKVDQKNER